MLALLDKLPLSILLIAGILLGLAPFHPQPHLLEKLHLLMAGELSRPLDIFDLLLHGSAPLLLLAKLIRIAWLNLTANRSPPG